MRPDRQSDRWLVVVSVASVCAGMAQLYRLSALRAVITPIPVVRNLMPGRFPTATDQMLVAEASKASVSRLDSVEIQGSERERLRAEWRSTAPAGLRLLAGAESRGVRAQRVHIAASPTGPRWSLSAEPAPFHATVAMAGDIHDPFEASGSTKTAARRTAQPRRAPRLAAKREAADREQKAAAAALAEAQRLDQRRRDILAGIALSAIMTSGNGPVALAEVADGGRRRTMTLHRGDAVMGATVVAIDERGGTLGLDVEGKTRIDLRVPGAKSP